MADPIPYQIKVKAVSPQIKSYHSVEILNGKAVETFHLAGAATEHFVKFYKLRHEEQIQAEIKDKLEKQSLPKLPKTSMAERLTPKPKAESSRLAKGTLVEKTFYCSKCKNYAYKGYLLAVGSYICRDCRSLERNPHPKTRIVFHPIGLVF